MMRFMEPNPNPAPIRINYLYFGLFLAILLFTATCSMVLKENMVGSRFFFFFHAIGQAVLETMLFIFGGFLLYTAGKLLFADNDAVDPSQSRFLKLIRRFVPTTPELHGQKMFVRIDGKRYATPLFAVLLLVESTDVLFAVDSVPAVLAVSKEQFIVFTSNAFAIMGLRSLYFMLADMHSRFEYLQQGLAVILAFVGVKMIISRWYHIPTAVSLGVIVFVLAVAIVASLLHPQDDSAPVEP